MVDYVASGTGVVTTIGTFVSGILGTVSGLGATVVGFIVVGIIGYVLFKRFF